MGLVSCPDDYSVLLNLLDRVIVWARDKVGAGNRVKIDVIESMKNAGKTTSIHRVYCRLYNSIKTLVG